MYYRFFHPDHKQVCFLYDDELPQGIRRIMGNQEELLPLKYEHVNAEDFLYCLIKAKSVHIEDRDAGFAYVNDQKLTIVRPYDCKWAVHRLLKIREKNPLIVSDRREQRYIWSLNDEDMRISQAEWMQFQRDGHAGEGIQPDFPDTEFTRRFTQAQKVFSEQSEKWNRDFELHRDRSENALKNGEKETKNWAERGNTHSPEAFIRQQQEIETKRDHFRIKKTEMETETERFSREARAFPEEELREEFARKQRGARQSEEDAK